MALPGNSRGEIPLDADPGRNFLPFSIGLMVFFAALALAAALSLHRLALRWNGALSGLARVEIVWPEDLAAAERDDRRRRVMTLLEADPGIEAARPLEREEAKRLLEPWLGADVDLSDLPLPEIIDLELDAAHPADMRGLELRLQGILPGTRAVDSDNQMERLKSLAWLVEALSFSILALTGLASVVVVGFATRAGLAMHGELIELLHVMGATDRHVARRFQAHAFAGALKGGAAGLAAAAAALAAGAYVAGDLSQTLLPDFRLPLPHWALLCLLPPMAALIAMLTARRTVLRQLGLMV
jgi:cell division transport system permease protein